MSFSLLPRFMTRRLTDLTPEFLKEQGENVVVVDASRGIDEVSEDVRAQVFAVLNIGK